MADKSFGVRQINIAGSGTPTVDSSTSLVVNTNGSERVRVDSSGNVGIGTTNPAVTVHVEDAQAELQLKSTSGTNSAGLRFVPGGATNALYIYADGSRNINFDDHATARLQIQSDGDLSISNGNLVFSTSGTGIDFSANSNAAGMTSELLDDYEEGTWDPVYNFTTSGDATVVSAGRYIKVGSLVHIQGYLYINNSNSLSGNVLIAGLPFAASSSPSQRTSAFVIGQARAWPEDHPYLRLLLEPNSTAIKMFNNDTSATSNARLTSANFTAAAEKNIISFSGAYTV